MKKEYLEKLLASFGVLYIKLHQYHWFVKGEAFFTLHELFENYYDETTADLDEIAERMLAIKLDPPSTLKEYINLSWIEEAPYSQKLTGKEMVASLLKDFVLLNEKFAEGLTLTEDDDVTNDILVGYKNKFEKRIWMLEAYLD